MTRRVELFWDAGSTNAYFALRLLPPILARTGASLALRPFNLGHVFRVQTYVLMEEPPAKIANRKRDLDRWAERYGLPFRFPSTFPIKTSRVLRASLAMRRRGKEHAFVDAVMSAYWERDEDIRTHEALAPLVAALGEAPADIAALAESEEIRAELAASTDDGLARGVFGAPSMFVGEELFWGKDRLDFVEAELMRTPA